ncbi:MAG: hypothetical protein KatS3mg071_2065 [Meiothermus sp.]|nr:MAG: hypothetical protein KatS3mg071_2065 [Meiothermus sp.]
MKRGLLPTLLLLALALTACPSSPPPNLSVRITSPTTTVATKGSVTFQVVAEGGPETVELLRDGSPLVTLTPPYSYTWDTTSTPEGTYTITARARRGSQTATSDPVQVRVDRTPPQITARRPAVGEGNVYLGEPLTFTFNEPLLPTSLGSARLSQGSTNLPLNPTLSSNGTQLSLRPQSLPSFTPDPAVLSLSLDGVSDLAGNAISGSSYSFSVPFWHQLGTTLDANTIQDAFSPSLALDATSNPVVAWDEWDGTSYNIYVKRWNGTDWVQLGSFLDANTNRDAFSPSLALDATSNPVVAWDEWDGTSYNIYVKRWNGTGWVQLGSFLDANTNRDAFSPSLALDATSNPVVAWSESDGTSSNIYVKRWNGTDWVQLGSFLDANTNRDAFSPSLALDATSNPVVAWSESDGTSSNIYVKRWNGTDWVQLGSFLDANTNRGAFSPSLALDATSNPVVAWSESDGTSSNIYVKRWNGTGWVQLGSFLDANTNRDAEVPSLALDAMGNPVVTWSENDGTSRNIYIKRWNGTGWVQLGSFLDANTNQDAYYPSLVLDTSGNPVVAWNERDGTAFSIYTKRQNRLP